MTNPTHADTGRRARSEARASPRRATAVTAAVLCAAAAGAADRAGAPARARRDDGEDRLRPPAAAASDRDADAADGSRDPLRAEAVGLQGRQVPRPLRVARRRDRLAAGSGTRSRCRSNARSYAADPTIVGVIGTYNSGCAAIEIPILNRAALAMVSPGNTYAGLTKAALGNDFGEPATYYPAGGRNYTRVVPSDDNEGRIAAAYMKRTLHATKVFVLNDRSDYGRLAASTFEDEAKQLGLRIAGHDGWDRQQQELRRPDDADQGDRRRRALHRRRLGPQRRPAAARQGGRARRQRQGEGRRDRRLRLPLALPAGRRADARRASSARRPRRRPTGSAARPAASSHAFAKAEGDVPIHDWTIFAAGATQVLLDAIARSDGTPEGRRREAVRHATALPTVLGPMSFDGNGDPKLADRGDLPGEGTATGSTSARSRTSRRSSRAAWPGRRRRPSRSRRAPGARRLLRAVPPDGRPLHGREHPGDAAVGGGVQAQPSTSARRRRSTSRAGAGTTGRGSPTTTTSTRPSASGWATCRTGCTSRPRRAGGSRRCSTTGPRTRTPSPPTRSRR